VTGTIAAAPCRQPQGWHSLIRVELGRKAV
jgi:hypothetical protein